MLFFSLSDSDFALTRILQNGNAQRHDALFIVELPLYPTLLNRCIDIVASKNPELVFLLGEQKTGMTGAHEIFSEALL